MQNNLINPAFISQVVKDHEAEAGDDPKLAAPASVDKKGFPVGEALRWAALGAGGFMDYDSTTKALGLKNAHLAEGNPAYGDSPSNMKVGLAKIVSNAGAGYLLHNLAKEHPKTATAIGLGLGALQAGIGMHNYKLYNKYKDK